MPEDEFSYFCQLFLPFDDSEEVVACQLSHFAGETGSAVGKENLGFAVAAGVEENLPRRGVAGVILEADVELEVAQRNPASFTAPAGVDQLLAIGQQLAKFGTGDRRGGFFEAGGEMVVCDGDF